MNLKNMQHALRCQSGSRPGWQASTRQAGNRSLGGITTSSITGISQGLRQALPYALLALSLLGTSAAQAQSYSATRTSSFAYDATTGLLTSETIEPNNPQLCVTTTYQYDAYGNKTSAITANCAGATGRALFTQRSSSSSYLGETSTVAGVAVPIPAGTFATTATNALIQSESKTFDPRFGAVMTLVGPNQLTTSWQVDDFGRKVRETRADGTYTATAYCLIASGPTFSQDITSNSANCPVLGSDLPTEAASFVQSELHRTDTGAVIGAYTRIYMDRAGRKIRTVTEAFDGAGQVGGAGRLVVQDTDYNALGVAVVTTQPYFLDTGASTASGSGGYGMSTTVYDDLGRPTAAYISDTKGSQAGVAFGSRGSSQASVTRISYNGLTVTTTNDQGQTRTEEKNVDGKVVRVTDALGAQLAHQYDAFGNLIATRDALQNSVVVTYDTRGRKTSMTDPDTGLWKYDYDALGQLVWQESANQRAAGTVTTLAYDVLGRLTSRADPEYTSTWTFDKYADGSACNRGVGKLCETATTNGVHRKIVYDNVGRPINTRTDVTSGPSFATALSYDSATGRPVTQVYPTGLAVQYNYTTKGFLSSLTLVQSATVAPLPNAPGVTGSAGTTLAAGSLLWQAQSYNAWGKVEQQLYGNNVVGTAGFDALTGRVATTTAGIGAATNVVNYSYSWDSLDHLTGRVDNDGDGSTGAVTDNFAYDGIGRLQSYSVASATIPGLNRSVSLQYNALGSLLYKSDVGVYSYPAQGGASPHALQAVAGAYTASYTYDANGNVKTATAGGYRSISYTSFNLPDAQNGLQGAAGGAQYTWQYDENHQRIQETLTSSSGTRTTWMLHPDNAGGLAFESEQNGSATNNRHYLTAGGMSIGVLITTGSLPTLAAGQTAPNQLGNGITLVKVEYWHKDHLGSLVATTDHGGVVTAHYSYDPFGKRRTPGGVYDANGTLVYDWNGTNSGTDRGFTGHEHLDNVGVIHMNGRLFDPTLGVFMQGDPLLQDPLNLQNYNRYGYCFNNPMTCSDPTGQDFGIIEAMYVIIAIWGAEKVGIIDARTARVFTSIAVNAAVFGAAPTTLGQAATSGFASGAIATGNLKGALQGAFSAGMFFGAGNLINGGNFFSYDAVQKGAGAWGTASGIALHGVVGCVTSEAGGGKCGAGALSAAFSHAMAPTTEGLTKGNAVEGTLVSAVVGGTGSVLGGGKFANGAQTGAFSYLYNYLSHVHGSLTLRAGLASGILTVDQSNALAVLTIDADFTPGSQAATNAVAHAMCNAFSMSTCLADTTQFVQQQWDAKSPEGLANLLHFDHDSFAAGHAGGHPYTGSIFDGPDSALVNAWTHLSGDFMPSQAVQNMLIQRSTTIIQAYDINCGRCIRNWKVPKSSPSDGD